VPFAGSTYGQNEAGVSHQGKLLGSRLSAPVCHVSVAEGCTRAWTCHTRSSEDPSACPYWPNKLFPESPTVMMVDKSGRAAVALLVIPCMDRTLTIAAPGKPTDDDAAWTRVTA